MPYKTFAPFERLLAEDLNTYYSEQVAAIFTDALALASAIPAPVLGQPAYLTGPRVMVRWNGTAWKIQTVIANAKIRAAGVQSVPSAAGGTVLTLATVDEDTHGFTGTPNTLIVPADLPGLYHVQTAVRLAAGATGFRSLLINRNAVFTGAWSGNAPSAAVDFGLQTSALLRLAAGDAITGVVAHTQGTALNTVLTTEGPNLWLRWIAP